jgi:signal transduction histidine kinase
MEYSIRTVARVLHIEDDPTNLLLVRELLDLAGHEVIEARDGLEGTLLAKAHRPDIVLVDINVPELDGYEVTLRLRGMAEMKSTPIVALTGEGDRETTLAVGADGFIAKPIDPKSFVPAVEKYLSGYRDTGDRDVGEVKLRVRTQKIVERLENKVIELVEANRRLQEVARLRREFLRNLSHEFATPMTPVVGYLRLLLNEEMGPVTTLQRKCLESIETATNKLRSLVDTLLDVSALEGGRLHLYERDYDFRDVLEKAVEETGPLFVQGGVNLVREEAADSLPARGDPDKLCRALVHILDNAVKFTPRGGEVAVGVRVRKARSPEDTEYEAVVVDGGSGVSAEQIEKILEPFYQADGSPTRRHGGVGLGLAFARHVAQNLGGGIQVQSPPVEMVAGRALKGTAVRLTVKQRPPVRTNG